MKKLFIYFSITGNGNKVADYLKDKGYEIRRVIEKKKPSKIFFFMVLGGGFRAGLNLKAKLIDYNPDVSEYDEIVIGSPIWNARFTPALNSVLKQTNLEGKKLTFVFYSGSGEGKVALKKANKIFPEANVIFLKEPRTFDEELEKLKDL